MANLLSNFYIRQKLTLKKKLKTKKFKISLSLTDEEDYAVAFVTITI